jgi:N-acetylmuramoyl-L-alanine amidase
MRKSACVVFLLSLFLLPAVFAQDSIGVPAAVKDTPSWNDILHKIPAYAKGWKYIVIHHSGGASGNAAVFDEWHTKMGYGGLAYHFVIGNGKGSGDGQVEEGFRWKEQMAGTHVTVNSWYHNIYGIGICLVGDFSVSKPTEKQMAALITLTDRLMAVYGIPIENVIGQKDVQHGDIDWTDSALTVSFIPGKYEKQSCPGKNFPWADFRRRLKE